MKKVLIDDQAAKLQVIVMLLMRMLIADKLLVQCTFGVLVIYWISWWASNRVFRNNYLE